MNSKTRFFMKIIFAVMFVIFLGLNFFAEKTYADAQTNGMNCMSAGMCMCYSTGSVSFTSPVVHQVNAQTSDVYYANFNEELNQPLWGEGNIFLFNLSAQGKLTGLNGLSAVNPPTNGQIITSESLWAGGAGGELASKSSTARTITTSDLSTTTGADTQVPFNIGNATQLEPMLGLTLTNYTNVCTGSAFKSESACADAIISFVLNPGGTAENNWKLGAIFHSDPVLVGPPPYPYSSASYQAFKAQSQYATRQQVLVVGANDGMLHGFDAGSYGTGAGSTPNTYGYGTGAEIFGYIPPNFLDTAVANSATCTIPGPKGTSITLPKISCWYEDSIGIPSATSQAPYEFVDSTPSISDVFFGNVFNEWVDSNGTVMGSANGTVNLAVPSTYNLNQSSPQDSWHTVLVGGERNGGTSYYAVGLTNPANVGSTYPDPLWSFSDATIPPSNATMGNTWSVPLITYVCLPNPNYSATAGGSGTGICGNNPDPASPMAPPRYVKTYTGFMGGGYSPNNSAGQAVYSLYVEPNPVNTGTTTTNYVDEQELWKFDSVNDSNMTYSIPSSISPVLSNNFRLEAFYVGDLGGQMWAFNIPYGKAPYNSTGASNWKGCRVFVASNQTTPPLNIFFPPALSYDTSGNLWLYFGTGNRENLTAGNTRDNELIGLNTAGTQGIGECASSTVPSSTVPYNKTDLTNETGVRGIRTVTSDGWYITLNPGEKVVGSPLVYDQIVYFVTYTPPTTMMMDNACGDGTAKLYAVYYLNGGGTITTSNGTTTISNTATSSSAANQSTVIGSGVPSAPVISNGNLIITTSTGGVFNQKVPSSNLIPTSWFQLP